MAENKDWIELEKQYIMQTFRRLPVVINRGKGVFVWDIDNKKYLDFVGGWAVNSLGHNHSAVVKSIQTQAKKLIHTSNQFYTIPQIKLAQLLVKNSTLHKVFFCNSGAEANEGAVKLARRYGKLFLNGAYEIITAYNSFHGRTLAMTAATGQLKFQEPYLPMPSGFIHVEYNNIDALIKATTKNTCAVMIEPVQGEGGVNVPSKEYMVNVRDWCTKNKLLFILDEVQTGIGRLGTLFGYQYFNIEPDVITLAKGLGSGIPIGALLAKEEYSVFARGEHGSTFGGNPLCCEVGYNVLSYIVNNRIIDNAKIVGEYFKSKLFEIKRKYECITEIRGVGLLLGICFSFDCAEKIVSECLKEGLLINAVKPNVIRFMPPLIINIGHVDKAIEILDRVIRTECIDEKKNSTCL